MSPEVAEQLKLHRQKRQELNTKFRILNQEIQDSIPMPLKQKLDFLKQETEAYDKAFNSWLQSATNIKNEEAHEVHLSEILGRLVDDKPSEADKSSP